MSAVVCRKCGYARKAAEFSSRAWAGLILFFITLGATGWYFLG